MLERHVDAMQQGSLGPALEAHDSRLMLWPRDFNEAHKELARCLDGIRSEPLLRRHVMAWYVDVDYRQRPQFRYLIVNGKRSKVAAGFWMEPRRDSACSMSVADAGVEWIVQRFAWDRIHLKAILEASGRAQAA